MTGGQLVKKSVMVQPPLIGMEQLTDYLNYWDPLDGRDVTREFYTGDMEANVKWWAKGHERYSTLDFDIITRRGKLM